MLEIGRGNGFQALNAKKLVGNGIVIGIDFSSKMLESTNRRRLEGMHFLRDYTCD